MDKNCKELINALDTLKSRDIQPGKIYVPSSTNNSDIFEEGEFYKIIEAVIPQNDWFLIGNCYLGADQIGGHEIVRFTLGSEIFTLCTLFMNGAFSYHILNQEQFDTFYEEYDTIYNDANAIYGLMRMCFDPDYHGDSFSTLVALAREEMLLEQV